MRLVLTDTDPDSLDLLSVALRRHGYEVLAATDGEQALRRVQSDQPHLVLVAVGVPTMDGFAVCRRLKQAVDTPVILLMGRHEDDDIVQGLRLGADDCVPKPVSIAVLVARI